MADRIIVIGRNSQLPKDAVSRQLRELRICPDCGGDGWVHGWGNNPSDPPFRVPCDRCNGEGAFEKETKA